MKFNTILASDVSGSIGSLSGAGGSGGKHFRRKILTNKNVSPAKLAVRGAMKEANLAWSGMTSEVKEQWANHGNTLINVNSTGHSVKQTGWGSFTSSYTLLKQSGMDVSALLLAAPLTTGYLDKPEAFFFLRTTGWVIRITTPGFYGLSCLKSPAFKNTINTNRFKYSFLVHFDFNWPGQFNLFINENDGRFFIKIRKLNLDGSMSLEQIYKEDF